MSVALLNDTDIKRSCAVIMQPGEVHEVRIPKTERGTVSGYFDNPESLAEAIAPYSGKAAGLYITLNPVNPALLARANNRVKDYARSTTSDNDVSKRNWILVDLDANRPSEISSTDIEHQAAIDRAFQVAEWLELQGINKDALVIGDSGNGAHDLIRVDLPNDQASTNLCQNILKSLDLEFSDDCVKVDLTTYNAARISKIYGTLVMKGDSTIDRPHRYAKLLQVPDKIDPVDTAILQKIADSIPKPPVSDSYNGNGHVLDIEKWLAQYGLEVARVKDWSGAKVYVLKQCPFNPDHNRGEATVIQYPSGAVSFGCKHDHCNAYKWADLRAKYEPKNTNNVNNVSIYLPEYSATVSGCYQNVTKSITETPLAGQAVTSEKIEKWISDTSGWFSTDELDHDLGIKTPEERGVRRVTLFRLKNKDKGVIEQHPNQNKLYRRIDSKARLIDFKRVGIRAPLSIVMPFNLEELIDIHPKTIIMVAGTSNSGKTALLINFVKLNMANHAIYYFSSEMGEAEFALRLSKFPGLSLEDWNFVAEERTSNFADVIRPDCINIIDFLEISSDFEGIADQIRKIYDRLGSGIAIIAIQKNPNSELGRGGTFSLEKARLYLAMENGMTKIVKAKNWANPNINPNKLTIRYKIINGCEFIVPPGTGWVNSENKLQLEYHDPEEVNF